MTSAVITSPPEARRDRPRARQTVQRLVRFVASMVFLFVLTFSMVHLIPGDPVRASLGPRAPQSLVDLRTTQLGLDQPVVVQFFDYVTGLFGGDLGTSLYSGRAVADIITERLPATTGLVGLAFLTIMVASLLIGLAAALLTRHRRHGITELSFTTLSGFFGMIPEFVMGVVLVYVFAIKFPLLPVATQVGAASYLLPVAALAIGPTAVISRIVRTEFLRVLQEDYMRTARSKRLSRRELYLRHALPNILTSTLTMSGLLLTGLAGGTVLVETVFAWPGLGATVVDSVISHDYPLAQAVMLFLGGLALVSNLIVDLVLTGVAGGAGRSEDR